MGRRFIAPVVIAAAALGCSAGPAIANATHADISHSKTTLRTFSNGAHKVSTRSFERLSLRALAQTGNDPFVHVFRHSFRAECTVPEPGSAPGYKNIYSNDTTDVVDRNGSAVVVGTCTANLAVAQVGADANDLGQKVLIPFSGKFTKGAYECAVSDPRNGRTLYGDEQTVVYPDGLYVSTCITTLRGLG